MSESGIPMLSLGSDGAANEITTQQVIGQGAQSCLTFPKPLICVNVQAPLLGNPSCPIVPVQDPKHTRKTLANQILSGTQLLVFGKYHVNVQQLASLLEVKSFPLDFHDVLDSDKQDDRHAYCTFNFKTLEAALSYKDRHSLEIYLSVCGEMYDVWLKLSIGHCQRKSAQHGLKPLSWKFGAITS